MVVWAVVTIGWLVLTWFVAAWALGSQSGSGTTPAGGSLSVTGNGKSVELACNAGIVTINGNDITYQSGNPAIDDSGVSSSIHLG